jgi:hypothetical protein
MALAEMEWGSKGATTLACTHCGRIQWFLRPEWLGPDRKAD